MPLLGREDDICLCRRDGQRAFHVIELVLFDERGMRGVACIELAQVGTQMPDDVLATKAVAYSSNFLKNSLVHPWPAGR